MKIFGIGLSKTGTNSLTKALEILGFSGIHFPGPNVLTTAETVDHLSDTPTVLFYKELDQKFPGSKFILTVRDKESWLKSVEKHWARRPPSTLGKWGKECRQRVYGSLYFDRKKMAEVYDRHYTDVMDYFKNRQEDLLVLDICSPEGVSLSWPKLCGFVNRDIPDGVFFPRSNIAPGRDRTVDVVYPYASEGEKWEEIRYSIRSIQENFLNLRNIWIVGDLPEWIDGVQHIPKKRMYPKSDEDRNLDYTHSILQAALVPEVSTDFLVVNDDHYLLTPRSAKEIATTPLIREDLNQYTQEQRRTITKNWQLLLWRTFDRLVERGYTGFNYENHIPVMVNKKRIIECWSYFGYGDGGLIWKTAYFNMFPPPAKRGWLSEDTDLKAGFYKPTELTKIRTAARDAVYLSFNDEGLTEDLRGYLMERFPTPSPYEKAPEKPTEAVLDPLLDLPPDLDRIGL